MAATSAGIVYVATHDRPLGASLFCWKPGQATPTVWEPALGHAAFRARAGQLVYLRETPDGNRLVTREPGGTARESRVPDVLPSAVLFAFPESDAVLLAGHVGTPPTPESTEAVLLFSAANEQVTPLPLPPTCSVPLLLGVANPSQALVDCAGLLYLSTFAGPIQRTEQQHLSGSGWASQRQAVAFDPGVDAYLGPVAVLATPPPDPAFHLLRLGPPNLALPPDDRISAVYFRPNEDLLLVQERAKASHRHWLVQPQSARTGSFAASAPLSGTPAFWAARDLLLWREGSDLVVVDTRTSAPRARVSLSSRPWPLPGTHQGRRFLVAADRGVTSDLFWFDCAPPAGVTFRTAATSLAGVPLAGFSAAGQDTCYVVLQRSDGPGLDLLALEP